jgi:predicted transcriptional regulator
MKPKGKKASKAAPANRVALSLRVTPQLKHRLDAAAAATGRSQTQEMEFRLERSFDREDLALEFLAARYGAESAVVLRALGRAMKAASVAANIAKNDARPSVVGYAAFDWLKDREVFDVVAATIAKVFDLMRPADTSNDEEKARIDVDLLSNAAVLAVNEDVDDITQIGRVMAAYLSAVAAVRSETTK